MDEEDLYRLAPVISLKPQGITSNAIHSKI